MSNERENQSQNPNGDFNKRVQDNWNRVEPKLRERYPKATDEQLNAGRQNQDQLVTNLQQASGESEQEVREYIDSCCR